MIGMNLNVAKVGAFRAGINSTAGRNPPTGARLHGENTTMGRNTTRNVSRSVTHVTAAT
jgi:hypothetical protein